MKNIKLIALLSSLFLMACGSLPVNKLNFENSISYDLKMNTKEIKKSGDFIVVLGGSGEKLVISENFLGEVLNQIKPEINAIQFFDLVYDDSNGNLNIPTQISDFRNGFLDSKVLNKYRKIKVNSIIYLWELEADRFKAIEVSKNNDYFLNIYVEKYSKQNFLAE